MRILFGSTDGQGHLRPLVPFLRAARDAGHDVALLTSAGASVPGVAQLVLPEPDDGDERGTIMGRAVGLPPEEGDRVVVTEVFGRLNTTATLQAACRHVREWRPDLVVHESACASARLAAEAAGVPTVTVHVSLPSLGHYLDFLVDGVADLRAGLGLAPDSTRMRSGGHATFFPASMEVPGAALPPVHRFRADSTRGARTGGAYVTLGTAARHLPFFASVVGAAVTGTTAAGLRTVLATGGPASTGDLPPGVEVQAWVDQAEVLRTARVVVCHGGSGTVLDVLAAAVPLVVVPLFADQLVNAGRVAALGVGVRVDPGPHLAARVAEAVTAAVGIEVTLADEMAALPHVSAAVGWFEELAG